MQGNSPSRILFFVLAVVFAAAGLRAQSAEDILNATPAIAQQCSGPLGSLLPECQPGKSPISISTSTSSSAPLGGLNQHPAPPAKQPEHENVNPVAPPEPPTEFQRFVASSVGSILPIFGANLFEKVPTTFAPLDRVPVTNDYVIGPGDEILLRAWGQVSLDTTLTVDRSGAVFVPQAGNIHVAGLKYDQTCDFLKAQLQRVFRNFDLNVTMGQLRSIQIFTVGQVRRPGTYTVSSFSTLVNALFTSGGPGGQGSMRRIQLKRGGRVVTELDLYDLLLKGDKSKDAQLLPGDVVYVPPTGPQLAIAGSVKNPGIYEVRSEKTIGDVIQMAGGLTALADTRRAIIERVRDHNVRESIEVRLDAAGLAAPAADGDILHVGTVTPRFDNTVTLRGNVANPGRFTWHAGMRLRDVIPDKESLVTREYWQKRNLLGFVPLSRALPGDPQVEGAAKSSPVNIDRAVADINWSYAVVERRNPRDLSMDLIPFHPGKLVLENDDRENIELLRGDVVTILSQADMRVASLQQSRFVRLEGEFGSAGMYAVKPGETLGQVILRAGGLTPQAYVYGGEFTRVSTQAEQQRHLDQFIGDLERDVEHAGSAALTSAITGEESAVLSARLANERDLISRMRGLKSTGRIVLNLSPGSNDISKLMDFPLEDGDRFLVPSRPATVNVLGSVYNQNAFLYDPNMRIADYLQQAGGANRNGDKARIFVIRADGSVSPKQASGAFSHPFESGRLNPGDSIVVPEAMLKGGFLRGIKDWSLVLSQFALGAAAANVLR